VLRDFGCPSAGTHPPKKLKEQTVQILNQVERNRLESRLGKGRGLEKGVTRRGVAARSAAVLMSLFRYKGFSLENSSALSMEVSGIMSSRTFA